MHLARHQNKRYLLPESLPEDVAEEDEEAITREETKEKATVGIISIRKKSKTFAQPFCTFVSIKKCCTFATSYPENNLFTLKGLIPIEDMKRLPVRVIALFFFSPFSWLFQIYFVPLRPI